MRIFNYILKENIQKISLFWPILLIKKNYKDFYEVLHLCIIFKGK